MDTNAMNVDVEAVRAQVSAFAQHVMAGEHLDVVISGALLLAIVALSLGSIWRTRRRNAAPKATSAGGMMRWLTPRGTRSVTAEQSAIVMSSSKRKSGSQKAIRVITPVSKVTAKLIRSSADPMEIARRSGLSRDGVAMMMAAAAPKAAAKKPAAQPNTASSQKSPARQPAAGDPGRAMLAPGAYTQAQRIIPAKVERPGVGTRFSARVS